MLEPKSPPLRPLGKAPAVAHAIAILRRLSQHPPEGVTSIARALNLSTSSCFNILRTLEMERIIAFDPVSKCYRLGAGLADLAGRALDPDNAFAICQPRLAKLTGETGATCALWRVTPEERLLLLGSASNGQATRIHLEVGQRIPLALGAAGRSVIAALGLSRDDIAQRFSTVRWDRAPSLVAYLDEIDTARRIGWATAVKDQHGAVRLSVSTLFFSGQRPPCELARVGKATLVAAAEISNILYAA
jgi:DNA-binding IclR family transcriptional regulator